MPRPGPHDRVTGNRPRSHRGGPTGPTADELGAAYGAVLDRRPDLTGDELARKARRVAAILRFASDGPAWTAGRSAASTGAIRGTLD